jgi:hypothetical protein
VGFLFYASYSVGAAGASNYRHLAIRTFEADSSDEIPADFQDALREHLLKHLQQTKRFQNVTILDVASPVPSDVDVVLSGKIVKFDRGSRFERYMVPGMGATSIRALVEYTDIQTGRSLLKTEVAGKVAFGVLGGDSRGATNGLAKSLAKATKRNLP